MKPSNVLVLPGWQNSGPQHWQSLWEQRHGYQRVEQHDWQRPLRGDWIARLEDVVLSHDEPVVLVAHSLGCIATAHLPAEASARIDAAEMMMGAVCTHAMEAASAGREPLHEDKLRYRRDAFFSVRLCLEAVDMLMTVAGSSGLYLSGTMQRLFRDAHAANAHVMFSPERRQW